MTILANMSPAQLGEFKASMVATGFGQDPNATPSLYGIDLTARGAGRPFTYNAVPTTLKRWRRALARAALGSTVVSRVLVYGDSTVRTPYGATASGVASALGGPTNGGVSVAFTDRVAKKIAARGYKTTTNSVYGMNTFTAAQFPTYDPRVTLGAGWGPSGSPSLGGAMFANTTDTSTFAINFVDAFNTIVVRYRRQPSGGSFTVDVGGAVLGTVDTSGSDTFQTATISTNVNAAIGAVNIKRVAGSVEIIGVEAYDAANPGIIFINAGRGGFNSGNWNFAQSWFPGSATRALNADLIIDGNAGVNDVNTVGADPAVPNVSLVNFIANKKTLLNAQVTDFDVMMLTLSPQSPAFSTISNQELYRQAVLDLGVLYNIPVYDVFARWVSQGDMSIYGLAGDARHSNVFGHDDVSNGIVSALLA